MFRFTLCHCCSSIHFFVQLRVHGKTRASAEHNILKNLFQRVKIFKELHAVIRSRLCSICSTCQQEKIKTQNGKKFEQKRHHQVGFFKVIYSKITSRHKA
jgi:hypothetical protein